MSDLITRGEYVKTLCDELVSLANEAQLRLGKHPTSLDMIAFGFAFTILHIEESKKADFNSKIQRHIEAFRAERQHHKASP